MAAQVTPTTTIGRAVSLLAFDGRTRSPLWSQAAGD